MYIYISMHACIYLLELEKECQKPTLKTYILQFFDIIFSFAFFALGDLHATSVACLLCQLSGLKILLLLLLQSSRGKNTISTKRSTH